MLKLSSKLLVVATVVGGTLFSIASVAQMPCGGWSGTQCPPNHSMGGVGPSGIWGISSGGVKGVDHGTGWTGVLVPSPDGKSFVSATLIHCAFNDGKQVLVSDSVDSCEAAGGVVHPDVKAAHTAAKK